MEAPASGAGTDNSSSSAPAAAGVEVAHAASTAAKAAIAWTPALVAATIGLFILAGLTEIGGGWLVWQKIREGKPWYYLLAGFVVLCAYGLVPTLQPPGATFSRLYGVYGGIFVVMSYAWGWVVDHDRPDLGDFVGAAIMLVGALLAWFWPRSSGSHAARPG